MHVPLSILGSLVRQLALAEPRGFAEQETSWVDHCQHKAKRLSKSLSENHLFGLLQNLSSCFNNVHLVVDVWDERENDRWSTVRLLAELNASQTATSK